MVSKTFKNARLEFIFLIIEISLNEMGLILIYNIKTKNYELWYSIESNEDNIEYFISDSIKSILEFCGLKHLYGTINNISRYELYDNLLYSKYMNTNLVKTKEIRDKLKKYNSRETKEIAMDFIKYQKKSSISNRYLFTDKQELYLKSIDNFFKTSIEIEVINKVKNSIENKFNDNIVKEFLQEKKDNKEVTQEEIDSFKEDFIKDIETYMSFKEYILPMTKEEVLQDMDFSFRYIMLA